jgi:very-short-patch-repair endonuclease
MTRAEKVFWEAVRHNRFMGYQFRRQQVIHGFIADFYCNDLNLVVEIDGGIHETQKDYDQRREEIIKGHQFNIIRFTNFEVVQNIDDVLNSIRKNADYYRSTVNKQ